jgi:hypothetical protein
VVLVFDKVIFLIYGNARLIAIKRSLKRKAVRECK